MAVPLLPSLLPIGAQLLRDLFWGEETFSSPTPATFWGWGIPSTSPLRGCDSRGCGCRLSGLVGDDCTSWLGVGSLLRAVRDTLKASPSPWCCGLPQQYRRAGVSVPTNPVPSVGPTPGLGTNPQHPLNI